MEPYDTNVGVHNRVQITIDLNELVWARGEFLKQEMSVNQSEYLAETLRRTLTWDTMYGMIDQVILEFFDNHEHPEIWDPHYGSIQPEQVIFHSSKLFEPLSIHSPQSSILEVPFGFLLQSIHDVLSPFGILHKSIQDAFQNSKLFEPFSIHSPHSSILSKPPQTSLQSLIQSFEELLSQISHLSKVAVPPQHLLSFQFPLHCSLAVEQSYSHTFLAFEPFLKQS